MPGFLVHGLTVEAGSTLGFDPAAELLAGFPAAPPGQPMGLTIRVDDGDAPWSDGSPCRPPAAGAGADTILLQAAVRAALGSDAIWIEAPGFLARVPLDGGRVEARRLAPGLDRHALVHVHLFLAFAAALRLRGRYHLHAACTVAPGGGAVLIGGHGRSGKSTLASALIAGGHAYLGDDVLFLDGEAHRLLAFPRPFHLGAAAAGALPGLGAHLEGPYSHAGKQALDARAAFPGQERVATGLPRRLLFPRIGDAATTTLEPLAPVEAVADLVESSAFVAARLPGHARHLAALAALADAAPAWRVTLGRDLLEDAVGTAQRVAEGVG